MKEECRVKNEEFGSESNPVKPGQTNLVGTTALTPGPLPQEREKHRQRMVITTPPTGSDVPEFRVRVRGL